MAILRPLSELAAEEIARQNARTDHPSLVLADRRLVRELRAEMMAEDAALREEEKAPKRHYRDGGPATFPHKEPKSLTMEVRPGRISRLPPRKRVNDLQKGSGRPKLLFDRRPFGHK